MEAIPVTKKLIAFGSKKIYLPKFTVALLRTPKSSPYHARFLVPLDFSKYDLRDYLFHAYNVKCFNIRSSVKQAHVRDTQAQPRHWFRPDSSKYMTVEMEQPFVWPAHPDMEPWGQKERQKETKNAVRANGGSGSTDARLAAQALREQVKSLLSKTVTQRDIAIEKQQMKYLKGWDLETRDETGDETKDQTKEETKAKINEKTKEEYAKLNSEKRLKGMSSLDIWKRRRPAKLIKSDDPGLFTIKT